MAPSFSICLSFSTDFDGSANAIEDDSKLRNKRVDRAALKQKHRKLTKIMERAYATSLDDIVFDSNNNDLDVMARVELKVKDGLPIGDLVLELLKEQGCGW